MGLRRLKPKTIKIYIIALRSACVDRGYSDLGVFNEFLVQREIYGIKRMYGEGEERDRKAITRDVLLQIFVVFRYSHQEGCYIARRIKAFTWSDTDHMHNFGNTCSSVAFFDFLPQRPTHFAREFRYLLQPRAMLLVRWPHCATSTSVFRHPEYAPLFQADESKRFSAEFVTKILRKAIMDLGHSRRRGAATNAGVPDDLIQLLGRWRSLMGVRDISRFWK